MRRTAVRAGFFPGRGRGKARAGIVDLPEGRQEWFWDLAPRPEMDFKYDIRHRVAGYAEFPKQAWLDRDRAGAKADR